MELDPSCEIKEECGIFGIFAKEGTEAAPFYLLWPVCPAAPRPGILWYCRQRYHGAERQHELP